MGDGNVDNEAKICTTGLLELTKKLFISALETDSVPIDLKFIYGWAASNKIMWEDL